MVRKKYKTSAAKRARDARYRMRHRADLQIIAAQESGDSARVRAAKMYRQHVENVIRASQKNKPVKLTKEELGEMDAETRKAYQAAYKREKTAYARQQQTFLRRAQSFTMREAEKEIRANMIAENRLRNPSTPKDSLAGKLLYSLTTSVWMPAEQAGVDRDQAIVSALGVRNLSEAFNIVASRVNATLADLMESGDIQPGDMRLLDALKNWKSGDLITGDVSWEELYHLLQNMPEVRGKLLDPSTVKNRRQHHGLS